MNCSLVLPTFCIYRPPNFQTIAEKTFADAQKSEIRESFLPQMFPAIQEYVNAERVYLAAYMYMYMYINVCLFVVCVCVCVCVCV